MYMSICLKIYLSMVRTCQSIFLSVCLITYLSVCMSVRKIYLSVYMYVCMSVCLSVCLSVVLSIYLSVFLLSYVAQDNWLLRKVISIVQNLFLNIIERSCYTIDAFGNQLVVWEKLQLGQPAPCALISIMSIESWGLCRSRNFRQTTFCLGRRGQMAHSGFPKKTQYQAVFIAHII